MRKPSIEQLAPELATAARTVAETLATAGQRAWIVGGAVRDLALGRAPKEVDMASAAPPEEVEALFTRALPLGRNFGTLLVSAGGCEVELTTFRSEASYSDGRRPDQVRWGATLEEDALRRDFTANAMYLDPLTGEFRDPTGGLEDLAGGRLVTVGGAADRFAEDGLRLLRLARFAAALDLAPTAAVLEGARKAAANLDNVSRERIAQELERLLLGPAPVTGLRLLAELDLFSHCLPTWNALDAELRWQALDELELDVAPADEVAGERLALGIAILLEADPAAARGACSTGQEELLASLRPSRLLTRQVHELWAGRRKLEEFSERAEERTAGRAKRLRLFRGAEWAPTVRLARAWRRAQERPERILAALAAEARAISQDELWPAPLLTAEDLKAAGLQPGPRFGELLEELEDAQLDGELDNRAQAEEWLALRTGEQSGPDAG